MALPGICSVCGNPNGPCIDFGLSIDYYGAVVICLACLNAAAEKAGLYDARNIGVGLNRTLQDGWVDLAANLSAIKEAEHVIINGFDSFNSIVNLLLGLRGVPIEIGANHSTSEPEQPATTTDIVVDDGQNVRVVSLEGTDGVPSDSSDEPDSTDEPKRVTTFTI